MKFTARKLVCALVVIAMTFCLSGGHSVHAAEWQWSVPDGEARAYLWIPPNCQRVRAFVLANHNMIEQGILEHPKMRRTLGELGFAEVWVVPGLDLKFDWNNGAGERFERIIGALAKESGYDELVTAPVVTLGHSANATWGWNFAAWNPARTLAVLSVHGDAPQTLLTGYGGTNVDWGNRNIDGVPGLMVMSEYEWWDARWWPAAVFLAKRPKTPLAFLADVGQGHFDYADRTVDFLAKFIEKAAVARLPVDAAPNTPVKLKPVDPASGWRLDRWRKDQRPVSPAAPYSQYKGNLDEAFWVFDEEMARLTEAIYAEQRGKKPQLLSVTDGQMALEKGVGEPVTPKAILMDDGLSFQLKTNWLHAVPQNNSKASAWTGLPAGKPLRQPSKGGPIQLTKIVGPAIQTGSNTFKIAFGRAEYTPNRRNYDVWVWAHHHGDAKSRAMVQQAQIRLQPNTTGAPQQITFPPITEQQVGIQSLKLGATSNAGLPVSYYVVNGPAEIEGDTLRFTAIPPRAKFPLKVTVVAWQWGRSSEPKVQTATPVTQEFLLVNHLE